MKAALIGHTGFVGGNLLREYPFAGRYHSANIDKIAGAHFDLVVCAGAPAAKWKANQDPLADRANLGRLMAALERLKTQRFVHISTVDVYGQANGVDEDCLPAGATAYGRHRLELEQFVSERFHALIVRLPALFGPGLKKNAIYDLMNNNQIEKIDSRSVFQFYNVRHLWRDIRIAAGAKLSLVHLATEPVSMARGSALRLRPGVGQSSAEQSAALRFADAARGAVRRQRRLCLPQNARAGRIGRVRADTEGAATMRLAISNIAWPAGADAAAAPLLHAHGVEGVELALTKIWPEPLAASAADVRAYRDSWEKQGVRIAALQALLFGKPHLTLFGGEVVRRQTLDYLAGIIERAAWLGAACSGVRLAEEPSARRTKPARGMGALRCRFSASWAASPHRHGVCFCIEPNPSAYGCDFVTTVAEGVELVDAVAEDGFGSSPRYGRHDAGR